LDRDYKIELNSEHCPKFRADRPTELGDYARGKKEKFEAKPNLSPPGALSLIGGGIRGSKISPASKSRGPNSNALAYAERALST